MPVLAMMIAPASRRFFVSVASWGGPIRSNAGAPPVVGISVVWMLSFSAIGMPCSGPRMRPRALSRSRSSASSSARGLTVIAARSVSSYVAMRVRYCWTIACDVVRRDFIAACISGMLASNTSKGAGRAGAWTGFWAGRAAGVWPVAHSRARMLNVCFMGESDLVASDEPDDRANELALGFFEMGGVVGARQHDPCLVRRAEAREQLRFGGQRHLRIPIAVHQQDRRLELRGPESVELVLGLPVDQNRIRGECRADESVHRGPGIRVARDEIGCRGIGAVPQPRRPARRLRRRNLLVRIEPECQQHDARDRLRTLLCRHGRDHRAT